MSDYLAHTRGEMWPYGSIKVKDRVRSSAQAGEPVLGTVTGAQFQAARKYIVAKDDGGSFECFPHELELLSPRFSWGRFFSALSLALTWTYILRCVIPERLFIGIEDLEGALDDNSSFEIYQKLCSYFGCILSCYVVGNLGEQQVGLWPILQLGTIGASIGLVIADPDQATLVLFGFTCYAWQQNKQFRDRLASLNQSICFRFAKLLLLTAIYMSISVVALFNYGSIELTIDGAKQKVEVKNLYATYSNQYYEWQESEDGKDFFKNLNQGWEYISYRLEHEGWENLFNEFSSQMFEDVGADAAKILDVDKNASCSEVKRKFRKLSRKLHPDKNPNDPEADSKYAEVVQAYDVMKQRCDPGKTEL